MFYLLQILILTTFVQDSLLIRPGLQRVADLQVQRDGSGLIALLQHPDSAIRARSAFALASVQDSSAAPVLSLLLSDPSVEVRANAAFAIGQLFQRSNTDVLVQALHRNDDRTVLHDIIEAIGKSTDAGGLRALLAGPIPAALLPITALAVGRAGLRGIHDSTAVAWLLPHLRAADPVLRTHTAYYFARAVQTDVWRFAAPSLRDALDHYERDDPAAMFLLPALARLAEPVDEQRLLQWLLQAGDWRIRTNAARAMGPWTNRPAFRAALLASLNDPVAHVAIAAAGALAASTHLEQPAEAFIEHWIREHPDRWQTSGALMPILARSGNETFVRDWGELHPAARLKAIVAMGAARSRESFADLSYLAATGGLDEAGAAVTALATRWQAQRDDPGLTPDFFEAFARALRRVDRAIIYTAAPVLGDSLFAPYGAVALMQEVYDRLSAPDDIEAMTALREALRQHAVELPDIPVPSGAARVIDWAYLKRFGSQPQLVLDTDAGRIVVTLHTGQAPLTVQTILQLAEAGHYTGVPFHRVVPNFVIQGGDFERGDGFGGPGYVIRSEFTRIRYDAGVIGMASAGKDTEGSQFFITHSMQPHLDGRYTAFGRVAAGMSVVEHILEGDRLLGVEIIPATERAE